MQKQYSVIYNTCDKYEPLWSGFFTLFKKYWPNFEGEIILNTETKSFSSDQLNISRPSESGEGKSWSQRLINSIDSIKTPFVILILDDFWFKSPVRNDVIRECVNRMEREPDIKSYTFAWQPGPNKLDTEQDDFEVRGRFAKYRVNAQIALWRVDYLKKILRSYETPWQFELSGSFRSSIYGGKLLSLKKSAPLVFDYDYGFLIIRGKINKTVADYFSKVEGIEIKFPYGYYNDNLIRHDKSRILRVLGYIKDMIVSLFKQ